MSETGFDRTNFITKLVRGGLSNPIPTMNSCLGWFGVSSEPEESAESLREEAACQDRMCVAWGPG
jgi:hypothetical protein